MDETKHTPGPWSLSEPRTEDEHSCGHAECAEHPKQLTGYELHGLETEADKPWIATILGEHVGIPADQCHANARLIAAAPALYDALVKAKETIRALHGIEFKGQAEAELWNLYQASPEMKEINAALALARIVLLHDECGTELKEATFQFEATIDESHLEKHRGEGHSLDVEAKGEMSCRTEGSGRYMKTFYGADVTLYLRCSCQPAGRQQRSRAMGASIQRRYPSVAHGRIGLTTR